MKYKFLILVDGKIKSNSGDQTWEIDKWKKHRGKVELCNSGFHCSNEPYQAFSFVQGELLAEVEVKGKSDIQDDKESWSEMRIVKAWKWQKKDSVALSIYAAELVISNYEKEYPNDSRPRDAIKAAKKWLESPTEENRLAAWSAESAAWSAAWSAAGSAAGSAAESARSARSAAWSAESAAWSAAGSAAESARSAAWSAAGSAAGSAIVSKIGNWFIKRVKKLEEYK